jgi:Short C-terminal domain
MPGLIRGVARTAAIAGTATAVSNRVSRRQAGRWAEQEQQQAPPQQQYAPPPQEYAPPPPPPGGDMDDKLAQLKELGALKEAGVLTDAEFAVQKDRILNP